MVSWTGRRKTLTILAFIAPMLIGILIFNVYPIIYSAFISLTNRNQFHPYPDCNQFFSGLIEPTCWGAFRARVPKGLGTPFTIQTPIFANYINLLGSMFTPASLVALLRIVLCIVPLIAAAQVNRRLGRQLTRPVSAGAVWLGGIAVMLAIVWLINVPGAFNDLLKAGDFTAVILRTLIFVALRVPLSFLVALVLALILDAPYIRGKTFFRLVVFIPWAASSLAILGALIWQFFFREQGTINQILSALFGVKGPAYLNNPTWAMIAVVTADVWFSYPFFMTIILGALQSIPREQYEAADVDGAGWWTQLTNITLPLIRPAILPAFVLTSISAFQMFGTAYAMTAGGPTAGAGKPGATEFVMVYVYKQVFQTQAYGRAGAMAVIIFILLFAATLWSLRVTRITKGAYE